MSNQSKPEQGSRAVAGKSNEPDGNLITPPQAEKVVEAKAVVNGHEKAVKPQLGPGDNTRRTRTNSPDAAGSI